MVGDIVAVGSAEPLVDVAAVAAPLVIAPHASHGTVAHRERRLQPAAERRHGGFRHHGIALHRPYRHAQQADSRALLPEDIAQGAYHAAIQVVILHRMAVFVRHELFVPRHGIAVDGRRSEELHTLGQVHHQPVRLKILGVHDEGDAHGAVAEPVRDVGLHGADVKQRAACHTRHGIGIDHPHVGRADRAPLQPRGVGTPRVILRPGFRRDAQGAQEQCGIQQPAHLRSRLFTTVAALGEDLHNAVAVVALDDDLPVLGRAAHAAPGFQQTCQLLQVGVAPDKSPDERHDLAPALLAVEPHAQILLRRGQCHGPLGRAGVILKIGVGRVDHPEPRFPIVVCHIVRIVGIERPFRTSYFVQK